MPVTVKWPPGYICQRTKNTHTQLHTPRQMQLLEVVDLEEDNDMSHGSLYSEVHDMSFK